MPGSFNQILLIVLFIIPGFILVRVKRLSYPVAEESLQATVLDSLTLSCVVHGLASPVWYWSYVSGTYVNHPLWFGLVVFAILFLLPLVAGIVFNRQSRTDRLRWLREFLGILHPDPTAWDYKFRQGRAYWVWLTFKSGQVMAGLFGPNSFAGSFPNRQDIYVEQLLSLSEDGSVVGLIENSAGAIVRMDDLERIEFFELEGIGI
jgi:hypothetical protein